MTKFRSLRIFTLFYLLNFGEEWGILFAPFSNCRISSDEWMPSEGERRLLAFFFFSVRENRECLSKNSVLPFSVLENRWLQTKDVENLVLQVILRCHRHVVKIATGFCLTVVTIIKMDLFLIRLFRRVVGLWMRTQCRESKCQRSSSWISCFPDCENVWGRWEKETCSLRGVEYCPSSFSIYQSRVRDWTILQFYTLYLNENPYNFNK